MTKPVIQFKHVQKQFGKNVVIPDLSFEINQGEFVTILGSSGSGKTTTLKMVNGLWKPNAGEILIDGQKISDLDLVQLRRHMGYVVQQIGLFPHMTIAENIAVVPKMLQWEQSKIDQRVKELLALVQLDPAKYANRYPSQLSGGQQQRVAVARAIAAQPPIILADEPTGNLDSKSTIEIMNILKDLHKSGRTVIIITHDDEIANQVDRVVRIMDGKIVSDSVNP